MKTEEIRWHTIERALLPAALFGQPEEPQYGHSVSFGNPRPEKGKIAVCFADEVLKGNYHPPSILVIEDHSAKEVFSWLRTYAPVTSPLSQFARVVSSSDWSLFHQQYDSGKRSTASRADLWACVVLGEILAQGDGDVDLATVPLSRATACFSTAVGRTSILHQTDDAIRTCVDRLEALEENRRFVQRSVSVSDIIPIWALMKTNMGELGPVHEVAVLVVDAVFNHVDAINSRVDKAFTRVPSLENYPALLSDSVEARVLAFNKLAAEIMTLPEQAFKDARINVVVAAAAFLVGRSTSHYSLLKRLGRRLPLAFAWFGLIAALSGPRGWDNSWSRTAKGVERFLRGKFDWKEQPFADLCWSEYSWMSSVFDGTEVFSEIPKMFPKVLSIEVVPGAVCQLRLNEPATSEQTAPVQSVSSVSNAREKELEATVAELIALANKAKNLMASPDSSKSRPQQKALSFDSGDTLPVTPKPKRVKRVSVK